MKKVISILLSLVLIVSLVPFGQAASFKDVSSSYIFYDEITYLTEKEIISGFADGTFKPNQPVTRAQAAIMIGKAINLNGAQQKTIFSDVGASNGASGYIQSAVNAGIIQGFNDGTFKPNNPVTRGQLAIFLTRAFNLTATTQVSFSDVPTSSSAYSYIGKLVAANITSGYDDNTYRPEQAVTRGQFSAFMARTLKSKEPTEAPVVTGDTYKINYKVLTDGTDKESIMNTYVNQTAYLQVTDGKNYVYMEFKNSSFITDFKVEGKKVETIKEANDSKIVKFEVADLSTKTNAWVKVDIAAMNYHHEYDIQLQFDVASMVKTTEPIPN